MNLSRVVVCSYLGVLLLQPVWHGALPPPHGSHSWPLALVASLPLLLPISGIVSGRIRSMTWGGYLLVLYFVIGIMEAWSNPAQRLPALAQVGLTVLYFCSLVALTRRLRPQR